MRMVVVVVMGLLVFAFPSHGSTVLGTVGTIHENANSQCATWDNSLLSVHVPCMNLGSTSYWLDIKYAAPHFELTNIGDNGSQGSAVECASFDVPTSVLHLPCVDLGRKYWVDLTLLPGTSPLKLDASDFGEVLPDGDWTGPGLAFKLVSGQIQDFRYSFAGSCGTCNIAIPSIQSTSSAFSLSNAGAEVTLAGTFSNDQMTALISVNSAYCQLTNHSLAANRVLPAAASSLAMSSDAGDYIGNGQTYSYTKSDATFALQSSSDNGLHINVENWSLHFVAPNKGKLSVGTYTGAARYPFQKTGEPGLSIYGHSRGCNTVTGSFSITEVVYGTGSDILSFQASFEQHCDGKVPKLSGSLVYRAND